MGSEVECNPVPKCCVIPQGHSFLLRSRSCLRKAFEALKHTFTTAPILAHFNPDNPIVVETDASDYAIAAIISQISPDDGDIHPIVFYSHSMQPAELNYKIYDKELLEIFEAFRQWRNYLEGSAHVVLMLSDHKASSTSQPPSSSPVSKCTGHNTSQGSTT